MRLDDPSDYYAERDVAHTAQGDIHAGVPFVHATMLSPQFEAAGARKRPDAADPDQAAVTSHHGMAIVLHYTCGITAQPPGSRGYAHEFRLVAPIVSLHTLKRWGMKNNELRKLRDGYALQGFMYLPQVEPVLLDGPNEPASEYGGHAAALIQARDRQPGGPGSRAAHHTVDGGRHADSRCGADPDLHTEQLRLEGAGRA
ncbi:MAG TPA: hypothetical protein VNY31_08675 [Solirubrobacteraceae bacterium]|jgi:hypothetical protein|nr:hypothetical protein [Solirubrobacteraceae bacterium]